MTRTRHLTALERFRYVRGQQTDLDITAHVQSCDRCKTAIQRLREGKVSILRDVLPAFANFPEEEDPGEMN